MAKRNGQNRPIPGESIDVLIAKIGFWQTVLVALISAAATGVTVYFSTKAEQKESEIQPKPVVAVPLQNSNIVKELPEESNFAIPNLAAYLFSSKSHTVSPCLQNMILIY